MFKNLGWNDKDANVYKSVSHDGNFFPKANALTGYDKKNNEDGPSTDLTNLLQVLDSTPKDFLEFEQRQVQPVINIRDWFTYLFTCVYANNIDGYDKNYYLYHDQTIESPFRVIPWDSDATWGNSWNGYPEAPGTNLWGGDGLSQKVFSIPEYTYSYLSNLKCLIEQGAFRTSNILAKVDAWAAAIGDYVNKDEQKWFTFGRIDNRAFPLELQDLKNNVNQRGTGFLNLVKQKVASVGRDQVVGANGQPFFTCGVAPSPKIAKEKKPEEAVNGGPQVDFTVETLPPPPPPSIQILRATICQGSTETIQCPEGTIISVVNAVWGRTDGTTCPAPNVGNTDCRAEATDRVRAICGQSQTCNLNGNNNDFTNPCAGIQKYLALEYSCVPSGAATAQATQDSSDSFIDQPNSSDSQSSISMGLIIGGVLAGVVLLVVVVAAIVLGRRAQKQIENEIRP